VDAFPTLVLDSPALGLPGAPRSQGSTWRTKGEAGISFEAAVAPKLPRFLGQNWKLKVWSLIPAHS
jgi:alpha-D-ribose 1-methylphosphonate 5-triphosphate synthase subunit PhnH